MVTKKKKQRSHAARSVSAHPENRAAEAVTVAWMLTTLACLLAQLSALAGWLLIRTAIDPEEIQAQAYVIPGLLLFVAVLTGMVCLTLTPLVYKARQTPPPRAITVFALLVGAGPLIALLVVQLASRS